MTADRPDPELVKTLQARIADEMTAHQQRREARGERELSRDDERQMALSLMQAAVSRHMENQLASGLELPDASYDFALVKAIEDSMFEAAELQEYLDDPLVEDVNINGCDEVWVTYADERGTVRGRPVTGTDEDLVALVQTLGSYAGNNARPFTRAHPQLDVRLPDGSRLSAVMGACERPAVSIRRNRYPQMFLPELVRLGTVDARLAAFLRAATIAKANIVIGGATGAGKTTILRALINCVDPQVRLVTVERALELGLRRHPELHPNVVELEEVLPDADGLGGVSLGELVLRTRRMDPGRVIFGEVIGPEAVHMLNAASQGNNGSLSTLHARSAQDVFARLATYAAQYEHLPFEVTHALISGAIDFVVFVEKNRRSGGKRCVTEVFEVSGFAGGRVSGGTIFGPSRIDGRAVRTATSITTARDTDLIDAGYNDADDSWPDRYDDADWSTPDPA